MLKFKSIFSSSVVFVQCGLLLSMISPTLLAQELAGSEWRPTEIRGASVAPAIDAFVRFQSDGRMVGHGGCNGFFGSYQLDGDNISIGSLGSTTMECEELQMSVELAFLETLQSAKVWTRSQADLTLSDEFGAPLMSLVQRDWD